MEPVDFVLPGVPLCSFCYQKIILYSIYLLIFSLSNQEASSSKAMDYST